MKRNQRENHNYEGVPDDGISLFGSDNEALMRDSIHGIEPQLKKPISPSKKIISNIGRHPSGTSTPNSVRNKQHDGVRVNLKRKKNSSNNRKAEKCIVINSESEDDSQDNAMRVMKNAMDSKITRQASPQNEEKPSRMQITAKADGRRITSKAPLSAYAPIPDDKLPPTRLKEIRADIKQKNCDGCSSRSHQEFLELKTELEVTKRLLQREQGETASLRDQLKKANLDAMYFRTKVALDHKESDIKEELRRHQSEITALQNEVKQLHIGRLKVFSELNTLKENSNTVANQQTTSRSKKKDWWKSKQKRLNRVNQGPEKRNDKSRGPAFHSSNYQLDIGGQSGGNSQPGSSIQRGGDQQSSRNWSQEDQRGGGDQRSSRNWSQEDQRGGGDQREVIQIKRMKY